MDNINYLANILKELDVLRLSVLITILSQVGVLSVTFLILKNKSSENKENSEINKITLGIMTKIQESFIEVTESFRKEQEHDWQRTNELLKNFQEMLNIQKSIYKQIDIMSKRIDRLEKDIKDIKNLNIKGGDENGQI